MSLTSHIGSPDSPVRAYLLDTLPRTKETVASLVARSGRPGDPHVLPADASDYPWSTVGTAFDYRVRFLYAATPARQLVAAHGAAAVARREGSRNLPRAFVEIGSELDRLLSPPLARLHDDEVERRLTKVCFVLALYEQCFRTLANPEWPIVSLGCEAGADVALGLCEDRAADDLTELVSEFVRTQPDLLDGSSANLNPTFAGSAALGGADADLIVDGLLVDLKTVKQPRLGREAFWQIAGYALADFDDRYQIKRVGLYYSRHGRLYTWNLRDFLSELAGRDTDVGQLRAEFAEVLEKLLPRRSPETRLRDTDRDPLMPPDSAHGDHNSVGRPRPRRASGYVLRSARRECSMARPSLRAAGTVGERYGARGVRLRSGLWQPDPTERRR
jgi:hypothetical protein